MQLLTSVLRSCSPAYVHARKGLLPCTQAALKLSLHVGIRRSIPEVDPFVWIVDQVIGPQIPSTSEGSIPRQGRLALREEGLGWGHREAGETYPLPWFRGRGWGGGTGRGVRVEYGEGFSHG